MPDEVSAPASGTAPHTDCDDGPEANSRSAAPAAPTVINPVVTAANATAFVFFCIIFPLLRASAERDAWFIARPTNALGRILLGGLQPVSVLAIDR